MRIYFLIHDWQFFSFSFDIHSTRLDFTSVERMILRQLLETIALVVLTWQAIAINITSGKRWNFFNLLHDKETSFLLCAVLLIYWKVLELFQINLKIFFLDFLLFLKSLTAVVYIKSDRFDLSTELQV